MLTKLTPDLFVESIEEQLPFWIDVLGFEKTIEVPESEGPDTEGNIKLGFVILVKDKVEVMLQTWKSIEDDIGWKERVSQSFLFFETDDIDEIEQRLAKMKKIVERRTTFYGATEIGVQDPAGNLVVFAQFGNQE